MASKIERLSDDIDARDLSVDAIVGTLTDRRCRTVLEHFVRAPESADVAELARCFAASEGSCSSDGPGGDDSANGDFADDDSDDELRDHIANRLHHVVLPKLADAELVRYDPVENVAELAESPARVNEYLRRTGRYGLA